MKCVRPVVWAKGLENLSGRKEFYLYRGGSGAREKQTAHSSHDKVAIINCNQRSLSTLPILIDTKRGNRQDKVEHKTKRKHYLCQNNSFKIIQGYAFK